jgi:hypothetical protein
VGPKQDWNLENKHQILYLHVLWPRCMVVYMSSERLGESLLPFHLILNGLSLGLTLLVSLWFSLADVPCS